MLPTVRETKAKATLQAATKAKADALVQLDKTGKKRRHIAWSDESRRLNRLYAIQWSKYLAATAKTPTLNAQTDEACAALINSEAADILAFANAA